VTLDRENIDYNTEINFAMPGDTIFVKAHSHDQMQSIDDAMDKLVTRLVKFKSTCLLKI
jgi:ribosome-associated translation inhibitor RaiA